MLNGIPKNELIVCTFYKDMDKKDVRYIITTLMLDKTWYWRYNYIAGKFIKTQKKAHTPVLLYDENLNSKKPK